MENSYSKTQSLKNLVCGSRYTFSVVLLKWFQENGRYFSWRNTPEPYRILVAELLLQQTVAKTAEKAFVGFMQYFPTIEQLAQARQEEVESLIGWLGLKYRSTRILEIAKKIVVDYSGVIPNDQTELLRFNGIGHYISSAILCFGYGKRVPVVDSTIVRLFGRLFGFDKETSVRLRMRLAQEIAVELLPLEDFVEYNYALLDLAALCCGSHRINCAVCPLKPFCRLYANQTRIPLDVIDRCQRNQMEEMS